MHRFFLSAEDFRQDTPILRGPEAHHCLDVLRLQTGDRLVLFDGKGNEATATIGAVHKGEIRLNSLLRSSVPSLPVKITLAQAIPKSRNMDWIIQKAVELGAACIAPLISERTVVRMDAATAERKQAKWKQVAIEACKQCGQNWLPRILLPTSPKEFLESVPSGDFLLIASLQPDTRRLKEVLAAHEKEHSHLPNRVVILIGPEGDFTPAEMALAKSFGCRPITLGPIVLRTETAALYCLSVISHEWNGR